MQKLYSANYCLPTMLYHHTHVHPTSKQWVTFIHGAGGSSAIWFKQIKSFQQDYNVLLIDLRGHGKSKANVSENYKKYTFEQIGNEVIAVLDHLNIQKSHFIGISLGTIIIRELAERHPDRIQSMILAGAVMKINLRGQILMRTGGLLKTVIPYLMMYKLLAFVVMPRKQNKESRYLFVREAKKLYQKEFIRWFSLISQINPLLALFRMRDTEIPTLYVMGENDYMFLPTIKKLVSQQPNAQLQVVAQCGHVVNIEQPVYFNSVCKDYLRNRFPENFGTQHTGGYANVQ